MRETIPGALSIAECEVLAGVARQSEAHHALEVGHYYGLSTAVLLEALPPNCTLDTVDHHRGDVSCAETSPSAFRANTSPYVGNRRVAYHYLDMVTALERFERTPYFDFVFYDADHSEAGVFAFWSLVLPLLEERCILVFDDADWESQATLGILANGCGFTSILVRDFVRGAFDKASAETYSLQVMHRS